MICSFVASIDVFMLGIVIVIDKAQVPGCSSGREQLGRLMFVWL